MMKRICFFSFLFLAGGCVHQAPIHKVRKDSPFPQNKVSSKNNVSDKDKGKKPKETIIQINCALEAAKK